VNFEGAEEQSAPSRISTEHEMLLSHRKYSDASHLPELHTRCERCNPQARRVGRGPGHRPNVVSLVGEAVVLDEAVAISVVSRHPVHHRRHLVCIQVSSSGRSDITLGQRRLVCVWRGG